MGPTPDVEAFEPADPVPVAELVPLLAEEADDPQPLSAMGARRLLRLREFASLWPRLLRPSDFPCRKTILTSDGWR